MEQQQPQQQKAAGGAGGERSSQSGGNNNNTAPCGNILNNNSRHTHTQQKQRPSVRERENKRRAPNNKKMWSTKREHQICSNIKKLFKKRRKSERMTFPWPCHLLVSVFSVEECGVSSESEKSVETRMGNTRRGILTRMIRMKSTTRQAARGRLPTRYNRSEITDSGVNTFFTMTDKGGGGQPVVKYDSIYSSRLKLSLKKKRR